MSGLDSAAVISIPRVSVVLVGGDSSDQSSADGREVQFGSQKLINHVCQIREKNRTFLVACSQNTSFDEVKDFEQRSETLKRTRQ